jgi:hypothetical protein
MESHSETGCRLGSFFSFLCVPALLVFLLPSLLVASNLGDTARQLADRIAAVAGPGTVALDVANRSSLDDKSVREVRSALEQHLRVQGIRRAAADQSVGTVNVILSESLREYVWTAEITVGSDQPRVVLVSMPRPLSGTPFSAAPSISLKETFLFSQEQPLLDAALLEVSGSSHLFLLDSTRVAIYRQQSGHWEVETSLAIQHSRAFPRDARGRLLLRRDHLFDAYLPGTICRSSATAPITMNCLASDDPWPLTPDEATINGANPVRAFYAPARNFFTGVLSPGIGKVSNVPAFYSAVPLARSNYTLWMLAAVDGSVHEIDGATDQVLRGVRWGSDMAAVRSGCGSGTQLLVTVAGDTGSNNGGDSVRGFEIPDREPISVSSPLEVDGEITALWTDASATSAIAIVKRKDTGWYEANRISISCGN